MPRALEVLDSLGLADEIVAAGYQVSGGRIMRDGKELARIDGLFDTEDPLSTGVSVNQSVVEAALRDKLAELGGRVQRQIELRDLHEEGDHVVAVVTDEASGTERRMTAKWLVGCDGAHSAVRKLIGLRFDGKEYPDQFVQADVMLSDGFPYGMDRRDLAGQFQSRGEHRAGLRVRVSATE